MGSPRRPKAPEVVTVEEPIEEQPPTEPVQDPEQGPLERPVEFVEREEYDRAVHSLRDEISELKSLLADLEAIVTAPKGSVTFKEVIREQEEDIPEFEPVAVSDPQTQVGDDIPFYQPSYLR